MRKHIKKNLEQRDACLNLLVPTVCKRPKSCESLYGTRRVLFNVYYDFHALHYCKRGLQLVALFGREKIA